MGQLLKIFTPSACLLLCMALAVQSAKAQHDSGKPLHSGESLYGEKSFPAGEAYPPADRAWDGANYRALAERAETRGLPLPTLSSEETRPIFERMVNDDNIPLRMGLNTELSVTMRYQELNGAQRPLHRLVGLYFDASRKGRPYAAELARLMVYEIKISGALLELSEPYLETLPKGSSYDARAEAYDRLKRDARQLYANLVQGMTETDRYAKPDILMMAAGALDGLSSHDRVFTKQDRQDFIQQLTQQISATADQELKTALTELRDAIKHRRVRT